MEYITKAELNNILDKLKTQYTIDIRDAIEHLVSKSDLRNSFKTMLRNEYDGTNANVNALQSSVLELQNMLSLSNDRMSKSVISLRNDMNRAVVEITSSYKTAIHTATSGLLSEADENGAFAKLFARMEGKNGLINEAYVKAYVDDQISKVKIKADQIELEGLAKFVSSYIPQNLGDANLDDYKFLLEIFAKRENTYIDGGLILTSTIKLGRREDTDRVTLAGLNGIWEETLGDKGIAAWFGADAVDHELNPDAEDYAKTLFRFDGSGYLASGYISWGTDSLRIGKQGNGLVVDAEGNVTLAAGIKVNDDQTLTDILNFVNRMNSMFELVDSKGSTISNDDVEKVPFAVRTKSNLGFYSRSFISAYGLNSSSGGGSGSGEGGGGGVSSWYDLEDIPQWILDAGIKKPSYSYSELTVKPTKDELNNILKLGSLAFKSSLLEGDIPSLPISKITNLSNTLDSKLDKSVFDELFEKVTSDGVTYIKAKYGIASDSFISAYGLNNSSGGGTTGGGGGVSSWNDLNDIPQWLLDAGIKKPTYSWSEIQNTPTIPSLDGYATELWVEGKGYLTEHQSLVGYATESWVEAKKYATEEYVNTANIISPKAVSLNQMSAFSGTYTKWTIDSDYQVTITDSISSSDNRNVSHAGDSLKNGHYYYYKFYTENRSNITVYLCGYASTSYYGVELKKTEQDGNIGIKYLQSTSGAISERSSYTGTNEAFGLFKYNGSNKEGNGQFCPRATTDAGVLRWNFIDVTEALGQGNEFHDALQARRFFGDEWIPNITDGEGRKVLRIRGDLEVDGNILSRGEVAAFHTRFEEMAQAISALSEEVERLKS